MQAGDELRRGKSPPDKRLPAWKERGRFQSDMSVLGLGEKFLDAPGFCVVVHLERSEWAFFCCSLCNESQPTWALLNVHCWIKIKFISVLVTN